MLTYADISGAAASEYGEALSDDRTAASPASSAPADAASSLPTPAAAAAATAATASYTSTSTTAATPATDAAAASAAAAAAAAATAGSHGVGGGLELAREVLKHALRLQPDCERAAIALSGVEKAVRVMTYDDVC